MLRVFLSSGILALLFVGCTAPVNDSAPPSCEPVATQLAAGAPACAGEPLPFAGSLCGVEAPCRLLADEVVLGACDAPPSGFGSLAVDASCTPHLLVWTVAETKTTAVPGATRHGIRTPNGWRFDTTPFESAGDYEFASDGTAFAFIYDGGGTMHLWNQHLDGAWNELPPFPAGAFEGAMALDAQGKVHGVVTGNGAEVGTFSTATGWSVGSITNDLNASDGATALGPNGTQHVAFWRVVHDASAVDWAHLGGPPETVQVLAPGNSGATGKWMSIAVTPDVTDAAGRPHLLYAASASLAETFTLEYATRDGGGTWSIFDIDAERPDPKKCSFQGEEGDICHYDYDTIVDLGLVASSGGDVRIVYSKVQHVGDLELTGCDPNEGFCSQKTIRDASGGPITIAWVDAAGAVQRQTVGPSRVIEAGRAVLDANGSLHIATEGPPESGNAMTTRYLAIGP
jgi:hypothetical protein